MITVVQPSRRRWIAIYIVWIVLCAALAALLSGVEDPSRRRGRILSNEAGVRALAALHTIDPARYRDYEVVHVAWAVRGEGGNENRWVVLCDKVPHTSLREAVAVEVRGEDGRLLRLRAPR